MVNFIAHADLATVHTSEPAFHQHVASNLHPGVSPQARCRASLRFQQLDAVGIQRGESGLECFGSE